MGIEHQIKESNFLISIPLDPKIEYGIDLESEIEEKYWGETMNNKPHGIGKSVNA